MATIRDIAEVVVKINDEEAKSKLPALERKAEEVRETFAKCFAENDTKGIKKAEKELRQVYRQMDQLKTRTMKIDEVMQHLAEATPKQLQQAFKQINAELSSGRIKRGTQEWDEYNEKLKAVKKELKAIADEQKIVTDSGLSMKDMLDIGGNLSMIFSSVMDLKDNMAEFMRDNVNAYIELEAEQANVRKYTGLIKEEVVGLNEEFKKINTRTSIIELNKLAEEAGRLGKDTPEDVLGFVKAADIINVALDDLGEGATLTISKLTNIFGDEEILGTEKSMLAVGSVINDLSQNCTASAPYLANFAQRMAGVGAQADMTIPQVMAFGAVLDAQGQQVEMSATALSQLIMKMFKDPEKIAKATGMQIKEFTNLVKSDTNAALIMLLEQLHSIGNMDVLAPIFKEMGADGARASAVLSALAGNVETVKEQQIAANKAYEEASSVVKEFSVQNETEEAKLEKKRKKLEEVKVALGEKLLPVMGAFTSTGTMMIKTLNALLDVFNEYKATILMTGSAVLLYTGYVKAKNFITEREITLEKAKLFLQEKSHAMLKKLKIAMMNNPWGIAVVVITTLIGLLIDYNRRLDKVSEGEKALGKIRDDAKQKMAEEENRLKALLKVAEDETASLENRKKAIDAINQIVPGYNAQLDATTGKYKANKKALDEYLKSLAKKYEIEGAKDMLAEMGGEKARLNIEKAELEAEIQSLKRQQRKIEAADTGQAYGTAGMTMSQYSGISTGALISSKKGDFKEINRELDAIAEKEAKIFGAYGEDLSNSFAEDIINNSNNNGGGGFGGGGEEKLKEEIKLAERAAKEKWVLQRAIEDAAYSRGEISYQEHVERLYQAELQYLDDCQATYEQRNMTEENGYLQLLEKEKQLLEKHNNELRNMSLDALKRQQQEEQNKVLDDCYNTNSVLFGNEKVRDQRLFEININYLHKKAALYREAAMSKEAYQIEQQIAQAEADEALRKQREYADRLKQWRKEYSETSAEEQMKAELLTLDEMHFAGLVKEEEYQQLRKAIQEKYTKGGKFSDGGYGDMLTNMYTSMNELINGSTDNTTSSLERIGAVAQATWAIAGSALKSYSDYAQAECDVEIAQIERKYDKMIEAAGDNSAKVKQLEEKKERDIAKVKNKFNKQAQKIEIAQAVASTAMAAINAYSSAAAIPVIGYILAPIAAAMATAAGLLQIATIKKQHQVQSTGYYSGGFTSKSINDHDEVGVVHANEFVANADAVSNPYLSPFFRLLDFAQKNNTIGSLTSKDVSQALGYGALLTTSTATANGSMQTSDDMLIIAGSISRTGETLRRLDERLSDGIEAYMVMDGERGFDKKFADYNRLKNNPRP